MNSAFRASVARAFGTLIPLALLALLISALILSVANDMYAFVKREQALTIYVEDPVSLDQFSKMLKTDGIINNPHLFKLYVISKGKRNVVETFCGEVELNSAFSYRQILNQIQNTKISDK